MKKSKKEPMVPQSNLETTAQQSSYELDDDSCANVAGGSRHTSRNSSYIRPTLELKCHMCGAYFEASSPHGIDRYCPTCAASRPRKDKS